MSRRRGGKLPKAAGAPEYDPMYDQHLEMYFSMPAIKSQLVKAGFVSGLGGTDDRSAAQQDCQSHRVALGTLLRRFAAR